MEKLQRQMNMEYAALQGSYWMAYCMVLSFASVFLLARNYSNSEIGVILAISNVLALLIQPLAAELADKSEKISILHILWILCAATAAFLLAASLVSVRSAVLSISYACAFALLIVLQPFITSLSFHIDRWGLHINFGACRAIGSLAYAVLAAIMGSAVEKLGMNSIPVSGLLCTALFMAVLAVITVQNRRQGKAQVPSSGKPEGSSIFSFIRQNKRYSLFLLGAALLFATHSLLGNFIIVIVRNVGGDSADMGRLCGYMALLEMPAMILFDRLTTKFRCSSLLKFSVVMFTVKALAIFLVPSVGFMYAAFTLQALSFAVYTPAGIKYAMLVVDGKDAVKAQAFLTLTGTLGSIFASLLGGVMFDTIGTSMTLLAGAIVSGVGSVIACLAIVSTPRALKG